MKNSSLITSIIITCLMACGDDRPDTVFIVPTNLEVSSSVSSSVEGQVSVTASATNGRHYLFNFGDGSDEVKNRTGSATHNYAQSGTYKVVVKSFGNSSEFISEEIEVMVEITKFTSGFLSESSYEGMTLVWSDEFDESSLNSDNWSHETGTGMNGWGNNELQYYRSENTTISNGFLQIEAKREDFSGSSYTSSRITSQDKQEFQYGRIDIRAILPLGNGLWPALWMLGADFPEIGWPQCGEIDVMEMRGREPDRVINSIHYGPNFNERDFDNNESNPYRLSSGTFADEWHVFSLIWDEDKIQWLVNDEVSFTLPTTGDRTAYFRKEFFFIFNVAVGGDFVAPPDETTVFPQRMYVDYIRVFQAQ